MAPRKPKAGRNRNGVGGVRKLRENLFQGTIQLAPGDRRFVSGHTRQEAEEKLAKLRVLYQQGQLPAKSNRTVGDYLRSWLDDDVKQAVAPRTYENYELNVRRVDPLIGTIRLDALKPDHLKTAYHQLVESGLSARSVQQVHRTMRAALRQAVKSEYLYRDPTTGVTPPRAEDRDDAVLTPEQVRLLLTVTADHYLHPLWVVLVTTGMRLGEALGLQWRDVDFEQGILTIQRQAQRQQGRGMVLSGLKTPASRRSLPLTAGTLQSLQKQWSTKREQCAALSTPWDENHQIFGNIDNALFDPGSINKSFHRALQRAGLPPCRVHDLRHTFSSFIQSRGRTEREAQEVLGHASASTTRNVYTHVMPDRRRDILLPVEELFPSAGPSTQVEN
jgi:integrase